MLVQEQMSKDLVYVPASMRPGPALTVAREHGVHYLLVVDDDNDLAGVTCLCQLARARVSDRVGSFASSPAIYAVPEDTLEDAAQVMRDCAVGCLVVVRDPGQVVGVITRHDLRVRDVLNAAEQDSRCVACGSTHDLVREDPEVPFCRNCLESTPRAGTIGRKWYCALGGGD